MSSKMRSTFSSSHTSTSQFDTLQQPETPQSSSALLNPLSSHTNYSSSTHFGDSRVCFFPEQTKAGVNEEYVKQLQNLTENNDFYPPLPLLPLQFQHQSQSDPSCDIEVRLQHSLVITSNEVSLPPASSLQAANKEKSLFWCPKKVTRLLPPPPLEPPIVAPYTRLPGPFIRPPPHLRDRLLSNQPHPHPRPTGRGLPRTFQCPPPPFQPHSVVSTVNGTSKLLHPLPSPCKPEYHTENHTNGHSKKEEEADVLPDCCNDLIEVADAQETERQKVDTSSSVTTTSAVTGRGAARRGRCSFHPSDPRIARPPPPPLPLRPLVSVEQTESVPLANSDAASSPAKTPRQEQQERVRKGMSAIAARINEKRRKENDPNSECTPLPLMDTHCHFDIMFQRLKMSYYSSVTEYFDEFEELYPPQWSLECAVHNFWRPEQLSEENWPLYSSYLDDPRVYGAVGVHPHLSYRWKDSCIGDIERCIQHPRVVAIGECGLDFSDKNSCNIEVQRRAFLAQVQLAHKWKKPLVIHSRGAYEATYKLLKDNLYPDHKIHLHCFVGNMNDIRQFNGYFTAMKFGITPLITKNKGLQQLVRHIDLDLLLSETDAPYFVPEELNKEHGTLAHPSMVYAVVEKVAELKNLPIDWVTKKLRENGRTIYGC